MVGKTSKVTKKESAKSLTRKGHLKSLKIKWFLKSLKKRQSKNKKDTNEKKTHLANSEQSLDKIVEKAGESQMRFGEDLEEANLNVDQADYSKSKAA